MIMEKTRNSFKLLNVIDGMRRYPLGIVEFWSVFAVVVVVVVVAVVVVVVVDRAIRSS